MSVLRKIGAFSIDSQWFEKSGLKDWILHNVGTNAVVTKDIPDNAVVGGYRQK